MTAFLVKLIFAIIIIVLDVIGLLLWIIGFGVGEYLNDDTDDDFRQADPNRFYFVWYVKYSSIYLVV